MKKIIPFTILCWMFSFSVGASCMLGWRANCTGPYGTSSNGATSSSLLTTAGSITVCIGQQVYIDLFGSPNCFGTYCSTYPGTQLNINAEVSGNTASATASGTTSGSFTNAAGTLLNYQRFYFTAVQAGTFYLDVYHGCFSDEPGHGAPSPTFFGKMEVKVVNPAVLPSISGNTNFCSGAPLSFTGSYTETTVVNHYWDIEPCDAAGTVTGPLIWSSWYTGVPGPFTFPANLNLPCGAYYKVKLAVGTSCSNWTENAKYIFISCPPTADAGLDQTICYGSCAGIGVNPGTIKFRAWSWSDGTSIIGNTVQMNVCPTVTTTYTLTATNTQTGCTNSDQVTITVLNNKPDFSISETPTDPTYMTVSATPMITSGTPAGFHHMWILEELDGAGTTIQTINSSDPGIPGCWWTFPSAEVFDGLDATGATFSTNSTCLPALGRFKYNTRYRFTRGTWSDACGWKQFSAEVNLEKSGAITVTEDVKAPDMSHYMDEYLYASASAAKAITIYPNPASDALTVEYALTDKATGELQMTDLTGKTLLAVALKEGTTRAQFNVSKLVSGTYLVQFVESGKLMVTEKVIVQ